MSKGRGCSWGTLRIPFGKIGEDQGNHHPLKNPIIDVGVALIDFFGKSKQDLLGYQQINIILYQF